MTITQSSTSIEHLPLIADDWLPEAYLASDDGTTVVPGLKRSATLASTYSNSTTAGQNNAAPIQLFDGLRVEEFLVDDDASVECYDQMVESHTSLEGESSSSDEAKQSTPESVHLFDGKRVDEFLVEDSDTSNEDASNKSRADVDSEDTSIADHTPARERLHYQSPEVEDESDTGEAQHAEGTTVPDGDEAISIGDNIKDALDLLAQPITHAHVKFHAPREYDPVEEKETLLSMLESLKTPQMNAQYLEAYGTCMSYILHIWTSIPADGKAEHLELLARLEQSLPRAEMLRRACEDDATYTLSYDAFVADGVLMDARKPKQRILESELRSLGDTVEDALVSLRNTPNVINDTASEVRSSMSESHLEASSALHQHEVEEKELMKTLVRRNTPPFLTWAWLSSGFEKSIPARRLAAENLFTIMQDIDRHLRRHNDDSYTRACEVTLAELTSEIADSQLRLPLASNKYQISYAPNVSMVLGLHTITESPSPLSPAREKAPPKDAILYSQVIAIHAVMDEIAAIAQNFVGLFIPCTYQHPVSKKIWGSLLSLLKVCRPFSSPLRTCLACSSASRSIHK